MKTLLQYLRERRCVRRAWKNHEVLWIDQDGSVRCGNCRSSAVLDEAVHSCGMRHQVILVDAHLGADAFWEIKMNNPELTVRLWRIRYDGVGGGYSPRVVAPLYNPRRTQSVA